MKKICLLVSLCVVNILGASSLDQGHTMISEQLDRFNALLNDQDLDAQSKRKQLLQVVEDAIDFESIALRTLGPYASRLTPEQDKRFRTAYEAILKNWLVDDLMQFENEEITLSEYIWLPNEEKVLVRVLGRERSGFAVTNRHRQRSQTEYVLKEIEGQWRIVDLTINNVNIARNYRSQISALARRGKSADEVIQLFENPSKVR